MRVWFVSETLWPFIIPHVVLSLSPDWPSRGSIDLEMQIVNCDLRKLEIPK